MAEKKTVVLSTKGEKPQKREFSIEQANKLLKLSKPAWQLNDPKFEWNGTEIAHAKK